MLLAQCAPNGGAPTAPALSVVTRVIDGDTIEVRSEAPTGPCG